ncbi:hypothetical protein QYE76_055652 [Lolium multiflorum]|uniref:histone deacetylase n=1 Tax=Lolium multiflorum TaxID=4521 RepID=A0AAD8WP47_LOLMU|nr:hypothetical protein QYE76_055652 [Lolium multiflorum]
MGSQFLYLRLVCSIENKPIPHPERPDCLRAIAASLAAAGIFPSKCALVPPREITKEELIRVHTSHHVESIEQTKNMLYSYFTSDTYANGHSACAAKLAAGLCADLASLILSGRVRNGFALVLSDDLIDFFFHLTFFLCMLHHDGTWELSINLLCISLVHDSDHALCPCLPEDM